MTKYQFTKDMNEISGFGGEYEQCCRRMLAAALEWLDAHPDADPQFTGWKNIYGVVREDNADAKALSEAALSGQEGYGASGAMHHAVISAALWIRANGWEAYVKEKTHPDGELGLMREKLAKAEKDAEVWRERFFEQEEKLRQRGEIIAERVLGWERFKTDNGQQEAYGPSRQAVLDGICLGDTLSKLVDDAIDAMEVAA